MEINTFKQHRTRADFIFQDILQAIDYEGDKLETRNHLTKSKIDLDTIRFYSVPLVTIRKTAWKKALREMEWFLSGESKCPDELLDWWKGQLDSEGYLLGGYSNQFRDFAALTLENTPIRFDQIEFIQNGLKNNPNSRRLILTSWNPYDMAHITEFNNNPNTPTTCHNTCTQFFVRNGALHLKTYQRSADVLLGVPHNWIQTWAMLVWFAHHANLKVGTMQWTFGDAHIYQEESHLQCVQELLTAPVYFEDKTEFELKYVPTSKEFKASDFTIERKIPEPVSLIRPKLL